MASFENSTYFDKTEFDHPEKMHQETIAKLDVARGIARVPFRITSDWRDDSKAHRTGRGVDISCKANPDDETGSSRMRWAIVNGLIRAGFTRIGVYDLHVHADDEGEETHPQQVLWIGKSQ